METQSDVIAFKKNKTKSIIIFFCGLAVLLIRAAVSFIPGPFFQSQGFRIFGLILTIIGGMILVSGFRTIADISMGLIIDRSGISINSTGVVSGLIPWDDITGVNEIPIKQRRLFLFYIKDPEGYMKKLTTRYHLQMAEANYKFYGTPIGLLADNIKCDILELERVIQEQYTKYKGSDENAAPAEG